MLGVLRKARHGEDAAENRPPSGASPRACPARDLACGTHSERADARCRGRPELRTRRASSRQGQGWVQTGRRSRAELEGGCGHGSDADSFAERVLVREGNRLMRIVRPSRPASRVTGWTARRLCSDCFTPGASQTRSRVRVFGDRAPPSWGSVWGGPGGKCPASSWASASAAAIRAEPVADSDAHRQP